MKKLLPILLLSVGAIACDDDEAKDPFTGSWKFTSTGIDARFDLAAKSGSYEVKNLSVNGEAWSRAELREVVVKKEIGMIIFSKDIASSTGMAFFSCSISSDKKAINADSVWSLSGIPTNKVVFYNQVIIRQ